MVQTRDGFALRPAILRQARAVGQLETRLAEAKATVDRYDGSIPSESALGLFLGQISHIIMAHDLTDQEVIPSQEIGVGELRCISVQMNCTGSLSGLFGFFSDLQSLGRLVRIEKATLKNDIRFTGQVTMQTEAVIFYRPGTQQEAGSTARHTAPKVADHGA